MLLKVEGLRKKLGGNEILRGINLTCFGGEKVAVLGPNGAGKTTAFLTISGFYKPDSGNVKMEDGNEEKDITYLPPYEKSKMGIAYLPQENSLFEDIPLIENFKIACELARIPYKKINEVAEEFGISHLLRRKTGVLSGGERRKSEIARICMLSPKFLILDEPFAGIDPKSVDMIAGIIDKLSKKGIGIILSDHNVRDVLKICDRVYLIYDGKIEEEGTPEEVVNSIKARKFFFGENFSL